MTNERARANGLFLLCRSDLANQPGQANDSDPLVALYQEWLDARREWRALASVPGNEDWDDPISLAAKARENACESIMLRLKPTSLEGIGALAALAWVYVRPGSVNPEKFAEHAQSHDCRAVTAIWKACTGLDGYPVI